MHRRSFAGRWWWEVKGCEGRVAFLNGKGMLFRVKLTKEGMLLRRGEGFV